MKKYKKDKNSKALGKEDIDLDFLLKPLDDEQIDNLTLKQAKILLKGEQKLRLYIQKLQHIIATLEEEKFIFEEKFIKIKNSIYSKSSEKLSQSDHADKEENAVAENTAEPITPPVPEPTKFPLKKGVRKDGAEKKKPENHNLLLTERYPELTVIDKDIEFESDPMCIACSATMSDSNMFEVSQTLELVPAQYIITRYKRHKYRCPCCHGDIKTAPAIPRIKPGSSYGDSVIIDVAMAKYCDLLPIERITSIAKRLGVRGLPQNSLIELTHYLADFLLPVYLLIRDEVFRQLVIHADETTHRMLEGHERSNWYLWGFSCYIACYFQYNCSRSGDFAAELLKDSDCEILISDVYSGYSKAVRITNEHREKSNKPALISAYCNAHSRRKFKELVTPTVLSNFILETYKAIYAINDEVKNLSVTDKLLGRSKMKPLFEVMKSRCEERLPLISDKSGEAQAINYFLNNFEGLTRFLSNAAVSIDNNFQERLFRSPVVGRKTWYGTHSEEGAKTAAILTTIVETCKMLDINPREYINDLRKMVLFEKKDYITPFQWKKLKEQ